MGTELQSAEFQASVATALFDESPDGILVVNQANQIVAINQQFFTVWNIPLPPSNAGYGRPETSDNPVLAMAVARVADPESFLARVHELYTDPTLEDIRNILLKDGRTLHRRSKALRNAEGAYLGRVWYFRDITERIRSNEALEESERRYALAFRTTQDAIAITIQGDGCYLDVNDAFVEMSGYAREEIIGRTAIELGIWANEEDRREIVQKLAANDGTSSFQARFRRKNGSLLWGVFSVSRLIIDGVPCLFSITRDITGLKVAHEELARHHAHLEELVAARTAELLHAKDAAEAANRAKSAFLANMSHEIRTPLNAITGMAHLIRRGGLSDKQRGQLDKLEGAGTHLLNLINAILELSKIEAGKLALNVAPLSVDTILHNVAAMLQAKADAKRIPLRVRCSAQSAPILGDATALQQALINYLGNAIKFTETGEIELRVFVLEEDSERIKLRFEVEDTGIGIAPETLNRLFKVFEQADNSTTRKYGGTGLGLAITRRLAELMDGEAGASSAPGRGSIFWFTAHLRKCPPIDVPPLLADEMFQAERCWLKEHPALRILVAEDEPTTRHMIAALLDDVGITADLVENGQEAVERMANTHYDLVLMDVQMPVRDGLSATQAIRAAGKKLPILAVTANAFQEDKERCLKSGMNDFITKPVKPAHLIRTIVRWLQTVPAS